MYQGHRRTVRRQSDDDAAVGLPHLDDLLRAARPTPTAARTPPVHLPRRPLLLSGSAAVPYAYYSSPPVGAIIVLVAGVTYLMAKDGSYSKKSTSSEGKVVYQSVPAPTGASIKTLPAERVLVTVSGTTYYLHSNAFYRRVVNGAQESFVTVTAPAGVVFLQALPPDFEVIQAQHDVLQRGGNFYVPFLAADGKELYVMVDQPPKPPAPANAAAPAALPLQRRRRQPPRRP